MGNVWVGRCQRPPGLHQLTAKNRVEPSPPSGPWCLEATCRWHSQQEGVTLFQMAKQERAEEGAPEEVTGHRSLVRAPRSKPTIKRECFREAKFLTCDPPRAT